MRTYAAVAAVAALTLLAGCPRRAPIQPHAFDKGQKAAILSLQAQPRITIWAVPGTAGPDLDAAPVLAELRPLIVDGMEKNPHFKLVPESKVFAAPAYVAHADGADPAGYISPPGYKPVTNEALFPQIIKEAGADMGMGIRLNLMYRAEDGAAAVVVAIGAIDAKGSGVWKGGASVVSDKAIDVRTAKPKAVAEAFRDATRKAMTQLEESMAAQLAVEGAMIRSER